MGCLCAKAGQGQDRYQAEEVAEPDRSNHPKTPCAPIGETIFLPHPEHDGHVDFDARLVLKKSGSEETHDEYVYRCVEEDGLAYNAGFRNGDVLIEVNGENIEGSGIENVLKLLRHYKNPEVFLAVRRNDPVLKYIWVIFKIVVQDGVPTVKVRVTLENDEYVLLLIPAEVQYFEFDRKSISKYDIFIDSDRTFYLTVDEEPFFKPSFNIEKSSFHKYYYKGNTPPGKGVVVVYSLQDAKADDFDQDVKSTIAGADDNKVEALNMPSYMVGTDLIPTTDPRFWYEKKVNGGEGGEDGNAESSYVSLESVNAPQNKFLNMGGKVLPLETLPAVLSRTPVKTITIASIKKASDDHNHRP